MLQRINLSLILNLKIGGVLSEAAPPNKFSRISRQKKNFLDLSLSPATFSKAPIGSLRCLKFVTWYHFHPPLALFPEAMSWSPTNFLSESFDGAGRSVVTDREEDDTDGNLSGF